jgi:hypothetical protein
MSPSSSASGAGLLACAPAESPVVPSSTPAEPTRPPVVQVGGPDPAAVVGTFRLCLGAPYSREFVGAATCTWSPFRTEVVGVVGKGVVIAGESLVPALQIREPAPGRFSLVRNDGQAGEYKVGLSSAVQIDADQSRQRGTARFGGLVLTQSPGQTLAPSGPRAIDASISWSCASAPATKPGFGAGSIVLRIDKPVAQEFRTRAECSWVASPRGTWVEAIDSYQLRARIDDRRYVGIEFPDPPTTVFFEPTLLIDVTDPDFMRIGDYGTVGGRKFVVRTTPDARSGRVRFLDLGLEEASDSTPIDGPGGTRALSGVLDWSCSPPSGAVPKVGKDAEPSPPETRRGTFDLVVDAPTVHRDGPASCGVRVDEAGVSVDEMHGEFALGGERVTLITRNNGTVAGMLREAGDGRYLGDYLNPADDMNVSETTGDGSGKARLNLPFNAADPTYAPLGGPGGPTEIDADLSWDCSL